ncbi:C39 family peptidase [Candidatus Dependentiae bacterium]|nr:C39 family peptidase [Candidatus Dependentiae bacterium]MBU4387507.1 C39 family peptidase [Candidatus Dependentiae bacterium]MCG2756311.1 C39 family peptidase [Candidatus Dependentiae bacterium]
MKSFGKLLILFISITFLFNLNCHILNQKNSHNIIKYKDDNIFSYNYVKALDLVENNDKNSFIWVQNTKKFTQLILSWNGFRPKTGNFIFYVSVKFDNHWSDWVKIDRWGKISQETYSSTCGRFVNVENVRLEMQKGRKANAFRVKAEAVSGADIKDLKVLYASCSNAKKFLPDKRNLNLPSVMIAGIRRISQWSANHYRRKDLCSPTSISMILSYYSSKGIFSELTNNMADYVARFAEKVRDGSYLDIYGAWPLNMAQVFHESGGNLFSRVQRLNGVKELYSYLVRKIPVAVSVRGKMRGAFKSYDNGHFIVVVGWDNSKKAFLCLDPAFAVERKMLRAYRLKDFKSAWETSRRLAYVIVPRFLGKSYSNNSAVAES